MSETTTHIKHFSVGGEWFTDRLRDLWSENNELGALKVWTGSFPDLSEQKHIHGLFLDIVSGSKGLTCSTADEDGLQLEDTITLPYGRTLLTSYEEVILLKNARTLLAEITLYNIREFQRLNKESIVTDITNYYFNIYYKEFNDMINLGKIIMMNPFLDDTPNVSNILKSLDKDKAYKELITWLNNTKEYFENKYGDTSILHFERVDVEIFAKQTHENVLQINKEYANRLLDEDAEDRLEELDLAVSLQKEEFQQRKQAWENFNVNYSCNPILSVLASDDATINEERLEFEPIDLDIEAVSNALISPDGKVYPCAWSRHIQFSEDIVKEFKLKAKKSTTKDEYDSYDNAERIVEENGWIKLSGSKFHWDMDVMLITTAQALTIKKLYLAWGNDEKDMDTFVVNWLPNLGKAIIHNEEAYEFNKRLK